MRILALLLLSAVVGCRTFTPQEMKVRYAKWFIFEERHAPKKLKRQLMPGMTREQVHAFYGRQPMSSHVRPEMGWATAAGTNAHTFEVAGTYEWLHEHKVQRCDVFESPVGHSYFMQLRPDIDSVFFDASDKLIDFHHEMVGD